LILVILGYALISGGVALSTGRKCSDQGLDRSWVFVPPHWDCTNPTYTPLNN
jgi:hypothetical protein